MRLRLPILATLFGLFMAIMGYAVAITRSYYLLQQDVAVLSTKFDERQRNSEADSTRVWIQVEAHRIQIDKLKERLDQIKPDPYR